MDTVTVSSAPVDVEVRGSTIRLGQFLQVAGLVDTGADAKSVVADGLVSVDGEVDTRRGRQLHGGEVVEVAGQRARVVAAG